MINITERGTSGRLYNRFRYLRKLDRENKANEPPAPIVDAPRYTMEDMLYLKTVVVSDNNIDEIRNMLRLTCIGRDELVKNDSIDFLEHFPFFFARPNLVSIISKENSFWSHFFHLRASDCLCLLQIRRSFVDFNIFSSYLIFNSHRSQILDDFEFKCKQYQTNSVNPNALLDIWPTLSEKLNKTLTQFYPKQSFETEWPEEIKNFLILIRLLPFKPGSRSIASAETFQNSIKRLLIFSKVLEFVVNF